MSILKWDILIGATNFALPAQWDRTGMYWCELESEMCSEHQTCVLHLWRNAAALHRALSCWLFRRWGVAGPVGVYPMVLYDLITWLQEGVDLGQQVGLSTCRLTAAFRRAAHHQSDLKQLQPCPVMTRLLPTVLVSSVFTWEKSTASLISALWWITWLGEGSLICGPPSGFFFVPKRGLTGS